MKKTGKKGFTLTELTVVLALVAIVSGMVVSFAAMISARTKLSTARLNAMSDLELVESVTEAWMDSMALSGADISSTVDELKAGEYNLSFYENTLTGTLPGGEVLTVRLDHVVGVEYTLLENNTGDCLCICTVTLELSSGETESRTICINTNPNLGDIYDKFTPDSEQGGGA